MPILSRRTFLLSALASFGYLPGCSIHPVTGHRQWMFLTQAQEIAIDQHLSAHQFSADYGRYHDPIVQDYFHQVGQSLAKHCHRPDMPFNFQVVNANHINAYAFPGGSIAVTRGILAELSSEAELAGLLGHEVGHVSARHTAQRMNKTTFGFLVKRPSLSLKALPQTRHLNQDMSRDLFHISGNALLAHYDRLDEREADHLGMLYMVVGQQNPNGMVRLMGILRKLSKQNPSLLQKMFTSHPMTQERYETALNATQNLHSQHKHRPIFKERFMDHTASIRAIEATISALKKAETLLTQHNTLEAKPLIDFALQHTPEDYPALLLAGKNALMIEQPTQAKSYFLAAQQVNPQEAQSYFLIGLTALALKKPDQALKEFTHYETLLPGNPHSQLMQAICHDKLGNVQKATEKYQVFLDRVPHGNQATYVQQRLQALAI